MRSSSRFPCALLLFAIVISVAPISVVAQEHDGLRTMQIEDYARWRSIVSVSISDDGEWLTYGYRHHRADDSMFVRNMNSTIYDVPRGSNPRFSDDSRWLGYTLSMTFDAADKLRKDGDTVPEQAGLLNLATGDRVTWDNVDSFQFSKGSSFLALKMDAVDSDADFDGTDLLLRNLSQGYDELIGNVDEFSFNKPGTHLAFTVAAAGRSGNGLYLVELQSGVRNVLDSDTLDYSRLTWNEEGTALAVLKGSKPDILTERINYLVAFSGVGTDVRRVDVDASDLTGFPVGYVISNRAPLTFSNDETRVFFGIKEQEAEYKDDEDNPVANVDIFHWNDDRIQTVQAVQANRDRNRTYQAAFNFPTNRFVQLSDSGIRNIQITRDGNWGIGSNDRPYLSDWKESQADYYRVNARTGERTLMFEGQKRTLGLSPDSKHFLYWKDGHVWDYAIEEGRSINLTESAPVSFVNEQFDRFGTKPPYGVAFLLPTSIMTWPPWSILQLSQSVFSILSTE